MGRANWNWKPRIWAPQTPRELQWQTAACGTPRAFGASRAKWLETPWHLCDGVRIWHSWEDFKEAQKERAECAEKPLTRTLEEVR